MLSRYNTRSLLFPLPPLPSPPPSSPSPPLPPPPPLPPLLLIHQLLPLQWMLSWQPRDPSPSPSPRNRGWARYWDWRKREEEDGQSNINTYLLHSSLITHKAPQLLYVKAYTSPISVFISTAATTTSFWCIPSVSKISALKSFLCI